MHLCIGKNKVRKQKIFRRKKIPNVRFIFGFDLSNNKSDKTLPEKEQMIVLKALNSLYDKYEQLIAVDYRFVENEAIIEIGVSFSKDTTYEKMYDFKNQATNLINREIQNSIVKIIVE